MDLRWEGYKKVHGQVCKRIRRRMSQLRLMGFDMYRYYLEQHEEEWENLDRMT
jgi:chemotaxis protein methyltransferase CheR